MLVPHLITALADEDANGTGGKNIVASAVCTMHDAETGGNAIILYDDENGSNGATSKLTDSNGQVVVYVTPGEYWKSVNGGTRRKVVVGNVGAFYGTAAEIAALRPIRDGQIAYATDRANAPLISSTTATAQPGDITAANGNVWVLQTDRLTRVSKFESLAQALSRGVKLLLDVDGAYENLTIPDGAYIVGDNNPTMTISDPQKNIFIVAGRFYLEGITFDMTGTTGTDGNGMAAISGNGDMSDSTVKNCRFLNWGARPVIGLNPPNPVRNIEIIENEFIGPLEDQEVVDGSIGGIRFLVGSVGNKNFKISRNKFSRTANGIQMRNSVDIFTAGTFENVEINDNDFFEAGYDTTIGNTWIETLGIDNYVCEGNRFHTGGRAMSCGAVRNGSFTANTLYNLYSYCCEQSVSSNVVYSGNAAYNCRAFVVDNHDSVEPLPPSTDIHIVGNTITGGNTGLAGWNAGSVASIIGTASNTEGYKDWTIKGNKFKDCESGSEVIYVSGNSLTSGFVIEDNEYIQRTENSFPTFIKLRHGSNHRVKNNTVRRYSDLTDSLPGNFAFISFQVGAGCDDIEISSNRIVFSGTDTRASGTVQGIGQSAGAGSLSNMRIQDNVISGNFDVPINAIFNDGDSIVTGNDTRGATGSDYYDPSIVYRQFSYSCDRNSAPTAGVWVRGDRVYNTLASASGTVGWVCVTSGDFSGTPPVFKAFGSISA